VLDDTLLAYSTADLLSVSSQAGSANLSNLNPASHLLLSLREQENLTRNSSLASVPKVR